MVIYIIGLAKKNSREVFFVRFTFSMECLGVGVLDRITIDRNGQDRAVEVLARYGICVISGYLSEGSLKGLQEEHSKVFSEGGGGVYSISKHPTNQDGFVARCRPKELGVGYEMTKQVFLSNHMRDLAAEYFGSSQFLLNEDVFFTHERHSENKILPWHFDRQQSLKFYVNLVDVDVENGAFSFDVGSHREGHFRANYYIASGVKIGDIPNDIPDSEIRRPVVVCAKAGDLVVFDPDGFHCAGLVSPGHERKVIRGHTHPVPNRGYKPKLFDALWWLSTPLNMARLLHKRGGRILPQGRLTKSSQTR